MSTRDWIGLNLLYNSNYEDCVDLCTTGTSHLAAVGTMGQLQLFLVQLVQICTGFLNQLQVTQSLNNY